MPSALCHHLLLISIADVMMYKRYDAKFEAQLAGLGAPFAQRVTAYKQTISEMQQRWKRVPRKQYICRYHPETSPNVPGLRQNLLRCPFSADGEEGLQTSLCQSVYAHRLFECPWQYVPCHVTPHHRQGSPSTLASAPTECVTSSHAQLSIRAQARAG